MQAKGQLGGDAEVAAAAVQRPEQLRVLVLGGAHRVAVGGHQLDRDQVVAGEAELALDPARAAAEGEAGDAGGGDAPAGGGEAVRLAGAVEVAPGSAALDACSRARPGSTSTAFIRRRSMVRPPSVRQAPATLWPPPRTATSSPCSRAKASAAATSSALAHWAIAAGRFSIIELKIERASS